MKLKLFFVFFAVTGIFTMGSRSDSASRLCAFTGSGVCNYLFDGTNPPHAVDITGKAIPATSATQPDKPIIFAKDSKDENFSEFEEGSAFDHVKHSTDVKYSVNGKTQTACTECHHTAQPSAPKGQEFLKRFDRKEILTTAQLEASKEPVQSCRECHFQSTTAPTAEFPPASVTYPKSMNRKPSGKLTNDVAYHINCNTCHREAKKKNSKASPPSDCSECHSSKS